MKSFFKKIVIVKITWVARLALWIHKPFIIAITGNVGKTSTKDAIYALLAQSENVRKSEKSMNSEIGLPISILGLPNAWNSFGGWVKNIYMGLWKALFDRNFPKYLVLEVGADHPGDIEKVSLWLRPDVVVLTRMSDVPVHLEYFESMEDVLKEKMFLAKALKTGGALVVNSDDEHFTKAVKEIDVKKIFYGREHGPDVLLSELSVSYVGTTLPLPKGQKVTLKIGQISKHIEIYGVLGEHVMYSIGAAGAVGKILGKLDDVEKAFTNFHTPRGRMKILAGISNTAIIDDTYNSSPLACTEAVKTISNLSIRGRKIAILGDMKELGNQAESAHRDIGRLAGESLHILVTVGELAQWISIGAQDAGLSLDKIYSFKSADQALSHVVDMVRAGDVILVKGSQSMRMEKIVKELLPDKFKAKDLLVRQEDEWLSR